MGSYKPLLHRLPRHGTKNKGRGNNWNRGFSRNSPINSSRYRCCQRRVRPIQLAVLTVSLLATTLLAYLLRWGCFLSPRYGSRAEQQQQRMRGAAAAAATTTYSGRAGESQRMLDLVQHITAPEAQTSGSGDSVAAQVARNPNRRWAQTRLHQQTGGGATGGYSTNDVRERRYNGPSTDELDTQRTAPGSLGMAAAVGGIDDESAGVVAVVAPADRHWSFGILSSSRRKTRLPPERGEHVIVDEKNGRELDPDIFTSNKRRRPLIDNRLRQDSTVGDATASTHAGRLESLHGADMTTPVELLPGGELGGGDASKHGKSSPLVPPRERGDDMDGTGATISATGGNGQVGRRDNEGSEPGGFAPVWERPSNVELEDIVRTQFGPWRTLSDAVARGPNSTTTTAQRQQQQADVSNSNNNGRNPISWLRRGQKKYIKTAAQQPRCIPMQQGMSPYPERELQSCYDKMREDYVFGEPLHQVEVVTMGEDRPVKETPRGVVVFMSTSRDADVRQLTKALSHISRNFLERFRYPVAIVHEDFTTKLMERLRDIVPVPIYFVKVVFKLPDWMEPLSWIYPLAVRHFTGHPKSEPVQGYHSDMHGILPYVKRDSFGYFHMCRFFGGAGYMLPFFEDFEFYLRLDSDSVCDKPLPDYFSVLQDANADYAFASTFVDYGGKAQGLWNFAERYVADNGLSPTFWDSPYGAGRAFEALAKARQRPPYPMCSKQPRGKQDVVSVGEAKIHPVPCRDRHFQAVPAFYTNFEVARVQMLRSSWYQDWFNAVDRTGSIYYNRWGDAPIRFIGLSLHLPAEKILRVNGCHHG